MNARPFHSTAYHLLEESLDLVAGRANDKGVDLGNLVEDGVPPAVYGDPSRLRQIILNLLSNAVKFTQKGEVVVIVNDKPFPGGRHELHFSVRDTGIGIPKAAFERLFVQWWTPASTTHERTARCGLGLAISKRRIGRPSGRVIEGKMKRFPPSTLP